MTMKSVLCINGSDSMGHSGIQADIRTIKDLGGNAYTAVTSVTAQNKRSIMRVENLPADIVVGQVRSVYDEDFPKAVKVGMIDNPEAIRALRSEIVGCGNIVCSPVVVSSHGGCLMSNESIRCFCTYLLPICSLLIIKCIDAEIFLGCSIRTDEAMLDAARRLRQMGAKWVLLRGGVYNEGRINALLLGEEYESFFSSLNIEGWQRHGVGGALSTAVAVSLANGDGMLDAVSNAHSYMHNQVVYSSAASTKKALPLQPSKIYNKFLSLVSYNYRTSHDLSFYSRSLSISSRYLSAVTNAVSGQTPKHIIDYHIMREAEQLLLNTSNNIQEIANMLGFSSQVAFTKFFRSKKHMSPSVFRNR